MEAVLYLTYIAIILLLGIICTIISNKIKIPNILLLIIVGMILSKFSYNGQVLIAFPSAFLTSIGILALVMIIFDSASRFKLREFDILSTKAVKLTFIFLALNLIFLTFFTIIVLDLKFTLYSVLIGALFSALMSGTDPAAVLAMFGKTKIKLFEFLEVESLLNTPLVVLLPFIIIDLMNKIKLGGIIGGDILNQLFPFAGDLLLRLIAGIGAGVLVGLIIFKIMKKEYSEKLSPLALIAAALLTYILAEGLGGNGVLAVTTMGLFFGNVYIKQKPQLMEFSSLFANSLEILVFVLVGFIISVPLTSKFLITSFVLFVISLFIRHMAILIVFRQSPYTLSEKVFMSLNVQKGIAVAVVAFTLTILNIPAIDLVLNMILMFMLYSIILSTIMVRFSRYFVRTHIKEGSK